MSATLQLLLGALILGASYPAYAQGAVPYPNRPVRMIVPFPAGGPTDALARAVAQKLGDSWGQQVVVDNRGGANGIIGQEIAARAAADGYTLLMQSVAFAINPSLYKLPYDSDRDFTPAILVASTSLVLTTHPGVPAKSVQELIALAKAKPAGLAYASFGNGSIAHLSGEMFKSAAGINLVHVPYKGVPQSIGDLIAGRVQVMFPGISSALPHAEAGRLRILAVTARQRSQLAPHVPTMIESGVPNFEIGSWFGAFLPAGTPQYIVRRLHGEIDRILRLPETARQFQNQGFEPGGGTPQQFSTFIQNEAAKFSRVIKAARIKVD